MCLGVSRSSMTKFSFTDCNWSSLALFLATFVLPLGALAQPKCVAPDLSDEQVKDIIDKARSTRSDLLEAYSEYAWEARKMGCHYLYVESGIPIAFHFEQVYKINQFGAIVDAYSGDGNLAMSCPQDELSESELSEIVQKARAAREDLPPPFPNFTTRVDKMRCLFLYFEEAVPKTRGNYLVFTIDPYGALMDIYHSKPY